MNSEVEKSALSCLYAFAENLAAAPGIGEKHPLHVFREKVIETCFNYLIEPSSKAAVTSGLILTSIASSSGKFAYLRKKSDIRSLCVRIRLQ